MGKRKIKLIQPTERQIESFSCGRPISFGDITLEENDYRFDISRLNLDPYRVFYFWARVENNWGYDISSNTFRNSTGEDKDIAVFLAPKTVKEELLPEQITMELNYGLMLHGFNGGQDYRGITRGHHHIVGYERVLRNLRIRQRKNSVFRGFKLYANYQFQKVAGEEFDPQMAEYISHGHWWEK